MKECSESKFGDLVIQPTLLRGKSARRRRYFAGVILCAACALQAGACTPGARPTPDTQATAAILETQAQEAHLTATTSSAHAATQAPSPTSEPIVNATTSGIIGRDETWRGEIHITGDIDLAPGVTLTIEPGTTIYLAPNSDDRFKGDGIDDDYTRGHDDPVRLSEWSRHAIAIDGTDGILFAVGTPDQPIVFRPEGDGTSPAQWDGVIIERGTIQYAIVLYGGRTAIQARGEPGGIEIAHNEVRFFHWAGIDSHTRDVWIHHNIVEGGGHQGIGVRLNTLAEHNIVIGAQTGIGVEQADGAMIRNNIVLDSTVGIDLRDGETAEVLNNTVLNVEGPPDGWYYQDELVYPAWSEDVGGIDSHIVGPYTIVNNIIYGQFDWGLGLHTVPAAGSQVDYNLMWGTLNQYGGPGWTAAGASNRVADPLFADVAGEDYHLLPGSPAIDQGDPGILDSDGSPSDQGAYGGPQGDAW